MTGCIGKIIDMHKEHAKLEELQRKASHDGLTGLLNHSHAEMIVREKLLEEKDRDYIIVIFAVNDSFYVLAVLHEDHELITAYSRRDIIFTGTPEKSFCNMLKNLIPKHMAASVIGWNYDDNGML